MLLKDFSGGLNTRVAPSLLQPTEAQVYTNVDNAKGSITPILGNTPVTTGVDKYFTWYYKGDEFISSAMESSFVEYRDILYSTTLNDYPTKYDGTNTYNLGILKPSNTLTLETEYMVTPTDTPNVTALPKGTYNYISVRTVNDGVNDVIKTVKFSHTISEYSEIELDTALFAGSTSIYREFEEEYHLVATGTTANIVDDSYDISLGATYTIANTLVYSYVYTYYDINTGGESQPNTISDELTVFEPIGTDFDQSAILVKGITESTDAQVTNIRLYRLGGDITEFSLVEELANTTLVTYTDEIQDVDMAGNHILDTYDYTVAPAGLKYLKESYAMLFGALDDKLYYSEIAKVDSWPVTNFIDFDADITGISPIQNGLIVCTLFKTYIVTGNSPETFSRYLLDEEQGCLSHYTMQFVDNSLIWLSQDGICTTTGGLVQVLSLPKLGKLSLSVVQNAQVLDRVYYIAHGTGILAFDFRYNQIVRTITTTADWLGAYKDTLYSNYQGAISSMFTGDALTYTYKSPVLTEGSYSNRKTYKDFYIKYNGDINLKVYVDGILINSKDLTGDKCFNLKALSSNSGYGMEIEITGTGIVSEIEYKAQGRDNGR